MKFAKFAVAAMVAVLLVTSLAAVATETAQPLKMHTLKEWRAMHGERTAMNEAIALQDANRATMAIAGQHVHNAIFFRHQAAIANAHAAGRGG